MFIMVSYDVADDKRRNRVAVLLENYGTRVQYSVFECLLTSGQIADLYRRLLPLLNLREDSVRVYFLPRGAVSRIRVLGRGQVSKDKALYLV